MLTVDYNADNDILTVNGIHYAGEMFRYLADPDPKQLCRFERACGSVVITKVDPQKEALDDDLAVLTKTHFGPGDVILVRVGDVAWQVFEGIARQVRVTLEKAKLDVPVIVLKGADADLSTLPEQEARQLYEQLRRRFGHG